MRRAFAAVFSVVFAFGCPAPAAADDTATAAAKASYERGLAEHARGRLASAARAFAEADAAVPSNEAIEAALDDAVAADDPVLGMTLVARAEGRPLDARAARARDAARRAFERRVGEVVVVCPAPSTCTVRVDDGPPVAPAGPVLVGVGAHAVTASRDGRTTTTRVEVAPGASVRVAVDAPERSGGEPARPAVGEPVRPGRVVVVVGLGVTAALGVATAISAADLFGKRTEFVDGACAIDAPATATPLAECGRLADEGRAANVRTGLLLGGALLAGATTLVTELFFVPKRGEPRLSAAISPTSLGANLVVRFR
jgi:hypothetical protein